MKTLILIALLGMSFAATAHVVAPAVETPASAAGSVAIAPPATTPPAAAVPPQATAAVDDDAIVCERVKELGSNMLKRVCKTVAQRDREREAARDALNTRSRDR